MLVTVPDLPAQDVQVAQVQTTTNTVNGKNIERSFKYCMDAASGFGDTDRPYAESADNSFTPVMREIQRFAGDKPPYDLISKLEKYSAKVVTPPKHGIVELVGGDHWTYKPKWNYEGADQVDFLVEVKGRSFKVKVNFWVMLFVPEDRKVPICRSQKFGAALNIAPKNRFVVALPAFAGNGGRLVDFRDKW
nr:hypothetical protein [uncultured Undibacterium sp.]